MIKGIEKIAAAEGRCKVNLCSKEWLECQVVAARARLRDFGVPPQGRVVTITTCQDGAGTAKYPKSATYVDVTLTAKGGRVTGARRAFARNTTQKYSIDGAGFSGAATAKHLRGLLLSGARE